MNHLHSLVFIIFSFLTLEKGKKSTGKKQNRDIHHKDTFQLSVTLGGLEY